MSFAAVEQIFFAGLKGAQAGIGVIEPAGWERVQRLA